jgi:hypothetical protein
MKNGTLVKQVGQLKVYADRSREKIATRPPKAKTSTKAPCLYLGSELPEEQFPPADGLGDKLSNAFAAIGVTKEGFSKLVTLGRSAVGCGCSSRQKLANWLGEQLGLPHGKGPELQAALAASSITPQAVHSCGVHEKCLPRLKPHRDTRTAIEGAGFHCCAGCKSYLPFVELQTIETVTKDN